MFSPYGPTGRSELNISATHFQLPSACFFHTSKYFPLSVIGLPLSSFSLNSYVPLTYARSPERATSTFDAFQPPEKSGEPSMLFQSVRMGSLPVNVTIFGGITTASSE